MAEKKRVLVAEDSSVIQNITKKVLKFQDIYEIVGVKNGQDVMKKLEKEYFDVILMDINMPKMDGMECTRQIRALDDPKKSKIPIIAITGNAKNYTQEDFTKAGINEYLPKPLNFDKLVTAVKKLVGSGESLP